MQEPLPKYPSSLNILQDLCAFLTSHSCYPGLRPNFSWQHNPIILSLSQNFHDSTLSSPSANFFQDSTSSSSVPQPNFFMTWQLCHPDMRGSFACGGGLLTLCQSKSLNHNWFITNKWLHAYLQFLQCCLWTYSSFSLFLHRPQLRFCKIFTAAFRYMAVIFQNQSTLHLVSMDSNRYLLIK